MSNDFSANSSALGYLFQVRYALYLLLCAEEEAELSIEKFDDVAFEKKGEPKELIQFKHHCENSPSLSDTSVDLWKTIRVWSTALSEGKLVTDNTILTLITTSIAPDDSIAAQLRPQNKPDYDKVVEKLESIANKSKNQELKSSFQGFLSLQLEQQISLVQAIRILDSSPNIVNTEKLIKQILYMAVRRERLDSLYNRVEGWWFDKVIRHLEGSGSQVIQKSDLHLKIREIAESLQPDSLPIDFFDKEPPDEPNPTTDSRVFVEQLKTVGISSERIVDAIRDYYKAFEQRSKWAREDLLIDGEVERYERKLIEEWKRYFAAIKERLLAEGTNEEQMRKCGMEIYNWVQFKAIFPIRPNVTESYVVRGSYHILANEYPPRVWWHPQFVDRLSTILVIPQGFTS